MSRDILAKPAEQQSDSDGEVSGGSNSSTGADKKLVQVMLLGPYPSADDHGFLPAVIL